MIKLWAFMEQADAESRVSHNQDLARSITSRMSPDTQRGVRRREPISTMQVSPGIVPPVRQHHQIPPGIRCLFRRRHPARACMVGEPPNLPSIYHCRRLLTRTSSRRCSSQCGSQRRSIQPLRLHWRLNLCVLIWMLCRPGIRRRAQGVLRLLAK